jgi:hypothetical protein
MRAIARRWLTVTALIPLAPALPAAPASAQDLTSKDIGSYFEIDERLLAEERKYRAELGRLDGRELTTKGALTLCR